MNKIYKLIWSKVRNCYVAVSEIAKRNGKSCTSVSCSGRSLSMAAVTLGVTASLVSFGSNVARADSITITDASNPDSNIMTLSSDGNKVWYPTLSSVTQLNIEGGYSLEYSFAGYYSGNYYDDDGNNVSDHTVNIRGGTVRSVYGGFVQNGDVKNNIVTFTGGSAEHIDGGHINWNDSSGVVSGNVVTLDGNGAIVRDSSYSRGVCGGYNWGEGAATGNRVEIKNGATVNNTVYGGYTNRGAAGGTTAEEGNKVIISSGTVSKGVYGGYVYVGSGTAGTAGYNSVEISGGTVGADVVGGYVASGSGSATGNTVTVSQTVSEDNSTIATSITGTVYGGYSVNGNAGGAGEGEGNTVTISGGTVERDLYGGKSCEGNATGNTVNMTGGTVERDLYGGNSDYADATGNTVNMTGGTVRYVCGGCSGNGNAGGANIENEDGTVTKQGNTVTISGGTIEGNVYGGYSENGNATGNTVTISGGTVQQYVIGGSSGNGNATDNTVILSKEEGKDAPVLNGTVYGGYSSGSGDCVTGNTLQLEAAGLSAALNIGNFETIRLAGTLAWENDATVFKANQFITNADGTRASLDVTDATKDGSEFVKTATDGQMTLLASDTAEDFKTLSLVYSGGTEALSETNLSKVVKTLETPEAAPVNGVTITTTSTHTVSLDAENSYKNVLYTVESVPTKLTLGEMAWGTGRDLAGAYTFDDSVPIDAANLTFTGAATTALKKGDSAALVSNATGITADNEVAQPTGDAGKTVAVDYTDAAGINFAATASGHVAAVKDAVNYVVDGVAVNSVNLAGWNGTTSAVPDGWTAGGATSGTSGGVTPETEDPAGGLTVETDGMTVPEVEAGKHIDILQANTAGFFTGASINGANAYKTTAFTESDPAEIVTIAGSQGKGVKAEGKNLVYALGTKDVDTVTLGKADFAKDAVLFDRSSAEYNYAKVKALGVDKFAVAYDKPETVAAGDTMTLLKANKTLADMAAQTKTNSYEYEPVAGVKVNATVTGSLAAKGGAVTYRAEENRASKLTFTNVDWKDSGALLTRPSNIVFAGADVDTAKIHFKNIESLQAKKKMTLVSDFGDSVGTITGNKYTVGTGLEGEGAASLAGSDLIFTAKTGTGNLQPQEQAHKAVMAMEAGIAMLAAGSEHVGMALGGLAAQGNGGPDGASTFVSVGGGASRYETGSHVNTNTWNALVAAGGKKETEKGTLQYGLFGEYGKGNYTLHSSAGRGDGDAYYAGGGLLARWTNKHNVYAEASFRLGRMSDTASDILHDAAGNGYGYDVHANYYGGHVGLGKVFSYKGGRSLDVYGKYFYTKRDGVNYTAGGSAYDLDSVASSVLRVGARYGTTDRKWNWYGGLAYDYEFDGEATGKVDGVAIRSASVKGGSVRGELGLRMDATKDNPWKADISVYGYGGKHRGFGGNVSVAYTF